MSTSVPSSFYEGGEVLLGSEAGFWPTVHDIIADASVCNVQGRHHPNYLC